MRRSKTIITVVGLLALLGGPVLAGTMESSGLGYAPQRGAKPPRPQRQLTNQPPPHTPSPEIAPEERGEMPPLGAEPNLQRLNRLRILQALGLTPEQWRKARQLHQRLGPKTQQLHDELEERQDAFNQAILSEPSDPKLVEQRLQAVLEKQQELMRAQVELEWAFRQILTPEQLDKFRDLQTRQLEIKRLRREIRQQQRRLNQELQPDRP